MSRILTLAEAEQIVKSMLVPLGFNMTVLRYDKYAEGQEYQLCNVEVVTKTVGSLWWKKKVETTVYTPAFSGWCWEDAIDKLDKWLKSRVAPRVDLADKFREQLGHHLLDEELKKP